MHGELWNQTNLLHPIIMVFLTLSSNWMEEKLVILLVNAFFSKPRIGSHSFFTFSSFFAQEFQIAGPAVNTDPAITTLGENDS